MATYNTPITPIEDEEEAEMISKSEKRSSKSTKVEVVSKSIKLLSFDEICGKEYDLEIRSPSGGKSTITLKALTDGDMANVRKTITWPTRKVMDLRKDPKTGELVKIYNEEAFQQLLSEANSELAYKLLVMSIVSLDIPGENDQEKALYLRDNVESWATKQLSTEMLRLVGIGEEAIDEAIEDFQQPTS